MKLVYVDGVFMTEGVDYQWKTLDRLLFYGLVKRSSLITVVNLFNSRQRVFGDSAFYAGLRPLERILDPAQKMDEGDEDGRRRSRHPELPSDSGD